MKRVLAIALSAAMLVSMLAGCSSNENSTETSTNTTEQTTEAPETTEEEAPAEEEASTEEETSSEIVAPEADVEMQYITVEDASANLESDDYTFIDVRKAEDYAASHIPGAISADMDAAKNGDFDAGVATMQEVLNSGVDNNLVLICYSGKTYAQATTNVLSALGYDKSKALMISGDFSQLVYAIRQDITFKLFTEGVVQNTDGSIAYNLMQNDMVALRAVMRLGWEIPNPINSMKTDKTKRCPFAILKAGTQTE